MSSRNEEREGRTEDGADNIDAKIAKAMNEYIQLRRQLREEEENPVSPPWWFNVLSSWPFEWTGTKSMEGNIPDDQPYPGPENKSMHPNGIWFGKRVLQSFVNIIEKINNDRPAADGPGDRPNNGSSIPRPTTVNNAVDVATFDRLTHLPMHRLLYFKDHVFEWGEGEDMGTYIGKQPSPFSMPHWLPVKWEKNPVAEVNCTFEEAESWAKNYRKEYGEYDLINNNCHNFAIRLAKHMGRHTYMQLPMHDFM